MNKQTGKFIARVAENLPEMAPDVMQWWIENPKELQKALAKVFSPPMSAPAPPETNALHSIDCDAPPVVRDNWSLEEHRKGGIFNWDKDLMRDSFYISEDQQGGRRITGNKLRKELKDRPVLNANVLNYLLAHPHLIPEEWKGKFVCFWGTVYHYLYDGSFGGPFVRYLCWCDDRWLSLAYWLDDDWTGDSPALVFRT